MKQKKAMPETNFKELEIVLMVIAVIGVIILLIGVMSSDRAVAQTFGITGGVMLAVGCMAAFIVNVVGMTSKQKR